MRYHIYSKCWDRQALANSADPDQTPQNAASDQSALFTTDPAVCTHTNR